MYSLRIGLRTVLFGSAASLCLAPSAFAASFTIPAGTTVTTSQTIQGGETGTIAATGALTADTPITWLLTGVDTDAAVISNSGTITATNGTMGIVTSGSGAPRSFSFSNNTSDSVLTAANDAIHIGSDIGSGTVVIDNFGGTIRSTNGVALNFSGAGNIATIFVGNFDGGTINSNDASAILAANNTTIQNGGQITAFSSTPNNTTIAAIEFGTANTGSVQNTGGIEGAARGIHAGTAITINNISGSIGGQNGEGIRLDTTSGTAIITNGQPASSRAPQATCWETPSRSAISPTSTIRALSPPSARTASAAPSRSRSAAAPSSTMQAASSRQPARLRSALATRAPPTPWAR
ncbi:MAG TPA: hypothetical protein VHZ78_01075 [Rhizomicrobium sp.]|nr:hypothetical protein [Rhizomicrobium sp.]